MGRGCRDSVRGVTDRRTPNFLRFIVTGAILGFAVGGFIAASGVFAKDTEMSRRLDYSASAGVGYLGLVGALLFGLAAAVLAVLLDRRK